MALFDRFGAAQAGNGQGPANPQQAQGSPNFQIGNWGNQPNFAGGMQQFMRPPGQMPMAQPGGTASGVLQGGINTQTPMPGAPAPQPSPFGAPQQQQPVPGQPAPMMGQAPTASGMMPPNMAGGMQPFLRQ